MKFFSTIVAILIFAQLTFVACSSDQSSEHSEIKTLKTKESPNGRLYIHELRSFELIQGEQIYKAHVVDLTHEGPEAFYNDIKSEMIKISDTDSEKYILAEGLRCTGNRPAFDASKFSADLFPNMSDIPKPDIGDIAGRIAYVKEYQSRLVALQPEMKRAGFLTSKPCPERRSDRSPRPASRPDFISQDIFDSWMRTDSGFNYINSDMDDSTVPEDYAAIVAAKHLSRDVENGTDLYNWYLHTDAGRTLSSAYDILVIHLYREGLIFHNLSRILEKEVNAEIVIPWGAFHSINIYSWLKERGFKEKITKDIVYAPCDSVRGNYAPDMKCYVEFAKEIENFRNPAPNCDATLLQKFNISPDRATYQHPFVNFAENDETEVKIVGFTNPFMTENIVNGDITLTVNGHFFEPKSEIKDSKWAGSVAIELEMKFQQNGNETVCVSQYFPDQE